MEYIWLFGFLVSFFICLFVIKVLEKLDWFDNNVDVQNATGFSIVCSLLWVVTIPMAVFFLSVWGVYILFNKLASKLADIAFKKLRKQDKP